MKLLHNVNRCLIVTLIAPTIFSVLNAPSVIGEVGEWEENYKELSFYMLWKEKKTTTHKIKVDKSDG